MTSSTIMTPPRPEPWSPMRSTPRRLASARAAGAARRRPPEELGLAEELVPPLVRLYVLLPACAVSMSSVSLVGMLPTTVPVSVEGAAPLTNSKSISGAPVAMTSPGCPYNVFTIPENGAGTSTTAFAVSTASIGWSTVTASPTLTCQRTISASARPSPRSGRLKVVICAPYLGGRVESFRKGSAHGVHDARSIWDVVVFEAG